MGRPFTSKLGQVVLQQSEQFFVAVTLRLSDLAFSTDRLTFTLQGFSFLTELVLGHLETSVNTSEVGLTMFLHQGDDGGGREGERGVGGRRREASGGRSCDSRSRRRCRDDGGSSDDSEGSSRDESRKGGDL